MYFRKAIFYIIGRSTRYFFNFHINLPSRQFKGKIIVFSTRDAGKIEYPYTKNKFGASQVAQMVKNVPAMQETQVWSLGWEDPLQKGMATHSSFLA